jgi:hypothetical protein
MVYILLSNVWRPGVLFFHVFSESQISRLTDDEAKALGAVEALHPRWPWLTKLIDETIRKIMMRLMMAMMAMMWHIYNWSKLHSAIASQLS